MIPSGLDNENTRSVSNQPDCRFQQDTRQRRSDRFSRSDILATGLVDGRQQEKRPNFILLGLFFSCVYWVLEAVRDVIAYDGSLLEYIFKPNLMDLGMRLMVVSMIMLFSAFTHSRTARSGEGQTTLLHVMGRLNFIWAAIIFSILYWVMEGLRDVFIYEKDDIWRQIFMPDPFGFWMRILAMCILILFGVYIESLIQDREKTESALKRLQDELDMKVARRTDLLAQENALLKEQMHLLRDQMANHQNIYHEKRAMIRQAYHVMKSTLQSLGDIVDRKIREKEIGQEKKDMYMIHYRISAISLVYSQFYQNQNSDTMDMSRFFRDLTDYLSKIYFRKQIYLDIKHGECLVPLSKAVICAIAFIELLLGVYEMHETGSLQICLNESSEHRIIIEIVNQGDQDMRFAENPGYVWGSEIISQKLNGSLYLAGSGNQKMHLEFVV